MYMKGLIEVNNRKAPGAHLFITHAVTPRPPTFLDIFLSSAHATLYLKSPLLPIAYGVVAMSRVVLV